MAVDKSTIISDVYKEFYDLIVAISGFTSIVFPTYPDKVKDSSSDYPIVIINSPDIDWNTWTFGKNMLTGTIEVEVYTTIAKDTDAKADSVNNKIELSKHTLATAGLQKVHLESTASDLVPHGDMKIHIKTLTFAYTFTSAKTRSF